MANTADAVLFCLPSDPGAVAFTAPNNVEARDDTDPAFRVGGEYVDTEAGKRYMYAKFDNGAGNVAAVAGNLAYVHAVGTWDPSAELATVTSDQSDGLGGGAADTSLVAGVFVNAITDGKYGFIQTRGRRSNVNVATGTAAGAYLVSSATDGRAAAYAAANTGFAFGYSLEAES